ncbi:ROK family protein [Marinifilum sp.]|uniref:ROK family protein n=1 Tax=Marinifilum sp. TaxID=2033137 RepID=UPI003BAA0476
MSIQFFYEKNLEGVANSVKRKQEQYRKIVRHLYYNDATSIAGIVKAVHISQPLVASLVDDLIGYGMLLDSGVGESIGGRRPNLFCINPDYQYVIGVEINLHTLNLAVFDLSNNQIQKEEIKYFDLEDSEEYLLALVEMIEMLISKLDVPKERYLSIGVSIPGLVDAKLGLSYTHLSVAANGLANYLAERIGLNVLLDNDARIMALGEKAFGKAIDKENVLCLNLTNGIGLGMILNGELHSGKNGFAGEFGHIPIEPNGELCHCGKIGCLETLTSGKVLVQNVKKAMEKGQPTILAQYQKEGKKIDLRSVVEAIKAEDQFAIDQLNQICEYLGKGLVTLIHLLNPEMVIIGGRMAHTGKYVLDPVRMSMNKYAMRRISSETEIVCSDLLDNAALMGTMANVMRIALNLD